MMFLKYLLLFLCMFILSCSVQPISQKNEPSEIQGNQIPYPWKESSPQEQNIDNLILASAFDEAATRPTIFSIVVIRNGYLVAEQYYQGYNRNSAFNVRSVSKSYLSALTGICLQKQIIDSLNQKMLSFFPEYVNPELDRRKSEITIKHLLTMKAGVDKDLNIYENIYYSQDWIQTTIELPLLYDPGHAFSYNTFLTHILSGILTKKSGMNTLTCARQYMTDGIGISIDHWEQGPNGIYFGGNSMYFTTRNMAVLGYIYLNNGQLDDRQIVPAEWVKASLQNHLNPSGNAWGDLEKIGYGYLWWLGEIKGHKVFLALGYGGQFVLNFPELNLVIATNSDAYVGSWDQADINERSVLDVVANHILPAVN